MLEEAWEETGELCLGSRIYHLSRFVSRLVLLLNTVFGVASSKVQFVVLRAAPNFTECGVRWVTISKNYSAKLTSKTTRNCNVFGLILPCSPVLDISGNIPLRWNDTLKIAMALLHRHLHQMLIVNPCPRCWFISPISGASSNNWTPEFQANWNWELVFFLKTSFFWWRWMLPLWKQMWRWYLVQELCF